MNDNDKKITTQESIQSSYQKLPHSNDFLLTNIKTNLHKILERKMPLEKSDRAMDFGIDEYSRMLKTVEKLKETSLSEHDREFLHAMEGFYYIAGQKNDMDPNTYKEMLRNVRDTMGTFYLKCALRNDYDITKNPLKLSLHDIITICTFIEKRFTTNDQVDRIGYFTAYEEGGNLKLVELIEQAKKEYPDFKKEQINIPLLLKIFNLKNDISKDVFSYLLKDHLGYTNKEISAINDKYHLG